MVAVNVIDVKKQKDFTYQCCILDVMFPIFLIVLSINFNLIVFTDFESLIISRLWISSFDVVQGVTGCDFVETDRFTISQIATDTI